MGYLWNTLYKVFNATIISFLFYKNVFQKNMNKTEFVIIISLRLAYKKYVYI